MNAELTPHPEVQKLRAENETLRQELARLFVEEQELHHIVRPNLVSLYNITLGEWELRRLEADVRARRLRRQTEEIQAALAAQKTVSLAAIEEKLDREFAEWQQRIRTQAAQVMSAKKNLENLMTDADEAEFKSLYRDLVRKLHPDLAGELSSDAKLLWQRVQEAHARHDLGELRALALMIKGVVTPALPLDAIALLRDEQQRLTKHIHEIMRRIADVKNMPPFTFEKLLADSAWVEGRRNELEAETASLAARVTSYEIHLAKILPALTHVHGFGPN